MDQWRRIAAVLSIFAFIKDFRPSDPFVVQFLNGPWHNITTQDINQQVFPVGTYSYGAQLVVTFLITDYFRYKPLIVLSSLAGLVYWALFIWTSQLRCLQLAEVFYGTYKAADVAFWSYIYVRVERCHYQKITCYTKSAAMAGKFVAAVGSQALLVYGVVNFLDLNYISLAVQTCTATIALLLPAAPRSIYFNRTSPEQRPADQTCPDSIPQTTKVSTTLTIPERLSALQLLWFHVKSAYSNFTVLRYSIWHALASCVYYQTVVYNQVLWRTIGEPAHDMIHWNGAVEAITTICAAGITFSAGFIPSKTLQTRFTLAGLVWILFAQAGSLLVAATTSSMWIAYGAHIFFSVLYSSTSSLLSAQIAQHIFRDSFGLVFGINAAVGSLLQIVLTLAVVDGAGLFQTNIFSQFVVYSCICVAMGALFGGFLLMELGKQWWKCLITLVTDRKRVKLKVTI
ncbi:thiamine transporter 1-like [Topomyia yanbarensis]|uniref:thiamine transporter 1-like n=1 Tax=Topomyia yanbarensis TaxID=2498891 RepID=UPI00273CCE3A|nr:thiamine transporter 1-like [Topomyia yanbarensis]